jgi:hypothetical protein
MFLSIGYPTAQHKSEEEIPDEELIGKTPDEIDEYIGEFVQEWANNYIETWYEPIKEGD